MTVLIVDSFCMHIYLLLRTVHCYCCHEEVPWPGFLLANKIRHFCLCWKYLVDVIIWMAIDVIIWMAIDVIIWMAIDVIIWMAIDVIIWMAIDVIIWMDIDVIIWMAIYVIIWMARDVIIWMAISRNSFCGQYLFPQS
jgi:hypothetical protein